MKASLVALVCLGLTTTPALAQEGTLSFDPVFGDHAVLQRDRPLHVRGSAAPGQPVTVSLAGRTIAAIADASGAWTATLPATSAGGPYRLEATDAAGNTVAITDVMLGDVFLCGGQSNMSYLTKFATNASNELKTPPDPAIRFATVPLAQPALATRVLPNRLQWRIAAPDTLGESSAVCYYMAIELKKVTGVTIGFVRSSLGGTRIERWLSAGALRDFDLNRERVAALQTFARRPGAPSTPGRGLGTLYNGMIAPIAPYAFKGVIWYQGESDVSNPAEYRRLLPALLKDWRRTFDDPELPFVLVQLTAFGPTGVKPGASDWAELREVQRQVSLAEPRTALVVSMDAGDRWDIHPAQKKIVGQRVARAMRRLVYGDPITVGGPRPIEVRRVGDDLIVGFDGTDGGLATYSSDRAIGFEVCDTARDCRYVDARTEGDAVRLIGGNRGAAAMVRYAWANSPVINLYGRSDIPAIPFEMAIP